MKIIIETIPHINQRYSTCGDWYFEYQLTCPNCEITDLVVPEGTCQCPSCKTQVTAEHVTHVLRIKVSALSDWKRESLIAVHELVEVLLCKNAGVTQEQVDAFDMNYERTRKEGDESEPGDAVLAPYRDQHCFATAVERMLCAAFGLSWQEYESEIGSLYEAEVASGQNKQAPANETAEVPPYPAQCQYESTAPEVSAPEAAPVQPVVPEMGGSSPPPVSP